MADEVSKYSNEELEERGFWDSRPAFWLAACGSAVGLGNIWRFPWRVANGGGAVFLIAYFIVLFFIGMPLLTQEMALGQKFRGGDVEAYGRIHPRLRGIGLASVFAAYGIVVYYTAIISIAMLYVFKSWQNPLPYADGKAADFLNNEVLMMSSDIYSGEGKFATELWGTSVFVWLVIFACVSNGVKSVSKVVMITMPVPILCLLILMINGFTLDGAGDGIKVYTWSVDWEKLPKASLWMGAIGQCFFSLSICMGVMTAYASYTKPGTNIVLDEKVVALCDVGIAYCGGFVIYSVLGHLQLKNPIRTYCMDAAGDAFYGDGYLKDGPLGDSQNPFYCNKDDPKDTTGFTVAFKAGTTDYTDDTSNCIPWGCIDEQFKTLGEVTDDICTTCKAAASATSATLLKFKASKLEFKEDTWYGKASFGLCFIAYPEAIATFKGSHFFATIFFFCLFLLGIDSAFSMVEALSTAMTDADYFRTRGYTKRGINGVLSLLGFLITTGFCTDVGMHWVDLLDYWINNYGLQLIGGLECASLGWVYRNDLGAAQVGDRAMKLWFYVYWTGITLATFFGLVLAGWQEDVVFGSPKNDCGKWDKIMGNGAVGVALPIGFIIIGGGLFWVLGEAKKWQVTQGKELTGKETFWALIDWHGPNDLRKEINRTSVPEFEVWNSAHEWKALTTLGMLNVSWGYLIKYFIPTLLLILTMNQLRNDIMADPFCSGGGFGWRNIVGVFVLVLMLVVIIVVGLKPEIMAQEYDQKASGTTGGLSTDPKSVGTADRQDV